MTDTLRTAGGSFGSPLAIVETDGVTILGDGTPGDPLRVPTAASRFAAESIGSQEPIPGNPVITSVVDPVSAEFAVSPATPGLPLTGMVVSVVADPPRDLASVLPVGLVNLTTAQWDAVTGQSGGLTRGAVYYLSQSVIGGITTTRPSTPGTYTTRVGIALSPTVMALKMPTVPIPN